MTANHTGGLGRQAVDWTVIASTGQRFVDFAPYVPSVNDAGLVAFQATLAGGGSGVFVGDGGPVEAAVTPPTVMRVTSHPDVNGSGKISFYGQLAADVDAVLLAGGGRHDVLEDTRGSFTAIGPLGPTMNEAGAVAFRANDIEHGAGVFVSRENGVATIATSSDGWSEFHGLPVVDDAGSVVFRATKGDRTHGIYTFGGGTLRTVVQTGEEFATLGQIGRAHV